jgi:CheY-like chemotaxis protein
MIAPVAADSPLLLDVGPHTILVVDDDAAMRMILGMTLRGFGYRSLAAEDGEQALQAARDHPEIRLVVLDVVMAGLSGKELADQLQLTLPKVSILFCSGYPASVLMGYGIDVSAANFVQKPCSPPDLQEKIEELMATR